MAKGQRLDKLLVERGLVPSRERARSLIIAGRVIVPGHAAPKPGTLCPSDLEISLKEDPSPYVSRAGVKLADALDHFGVSPQGRYCLDVGASTGGFTDVLLGRGARRVAAVDVGRGLIDWSLRKDERVTLLEGVNVRHLTPGKFSEAAGPERPELAVVDVSFISLTKVLVPVRDLLAGEAELLVLVKPQFEVGRGRVGRGGIVRERALHEEVLHSVWEWAAEGGFGPQGACASSVRGVKGNREFFLYLRPGEAAGERDAAIAYALSTESPESAS